MDTPTEFVLNVQEINILKEAKLHVLPAIKLIVQPALLMAHYVRHAQ